MKTPVKEKENLKCNRYNQKINFQKRKMISLRAKIKFKFKKRKAKKSKKVKSNNKNKFKMIQKIRILNKNSANS